MTTRAPLLARRALICPFFLGSLALASPQRSLAPEGVQALESWRAAHGSSWSVHVDDETGRAELLYGGKVEPDFVPRSQVDWFLRARQSVESARELLGVAPTSLVDHEVIAIPLAHLGTTDKVTVNFTQRVAGLSVEGARVHALFDAEGRLLSLHATALPGEALTLQPATWSAQRASTRAREVFAERTGLAATRVSQPDMVVVQLQRGETRVPRRAWRVEAFFEAPNTRPEGERLWLDASSGELLLVTQLVHDYDVGGTISALATPGTQPDLGSNPEQNHPMPHMRLSSAQGDVLTDSAGNFNFAGVSGPLQVVCSFVGDFANVYNSSGSEYSTAPTLQSGGANSVLMNPSGFSSITAQANAFYGINLLRDWVRSINPNDSHADFIASAFVNINQNCNAYFDGSSVNFFTPGGGCVNTAYSTIVAHEMGHWLNVRYGTGNGPDGMGEGNADTWAMYLYDTPLVGENFGNGNYLRSGLNALQFCGDFGVACHGGQVHTEGKVWMGAAWKIRDELNQALGNALGDDLSNALFLGWMASFNQTEIQSIIETQWILLDDDDGDINNGSPHFVPIEAGFAAQGWPGIELHPITFENVVLPGDSPSESGPYDAQLSIVPHFGQSMTSAQIHYRVNGGAWQDVDLAPLPDQRYAALLPDVSSPAGVELWFSATDSLGNSETWPEGGAAAPAQFGVGQTQPFLFDSFESGAGGWTHGTYGDTISLEDEWERGYAFGQSGVVYDGGTVGIHWSDPASPAGGFMIWGVDLGSISDGRHGNHVHAWLRSPAHDCTGRVGTRLRFERWASVHRQDELTVRVNDAVIWTSGNEGHLLDEEWTQVEYDISAYADGQAAVTVEFEIQSNGSYRLGGWQIDNYELLEFGPSTQPCPAPTGFGPAKPSSTTETPVLEGSGSPTPGGGFKIRVLEAALNQPAFLFSGPSWALIPYGGAYRLVSAPIVREASATTSGLGIAEFPIDVTGAMVGSTRYYQVWFRDPLHPDGTGVGLSRGLRVGYCP